MPRPPFHRLLRLPEQPYRLRQQVIEIKRRGIPQTLLVTLIRSRHDLLEVALALPLEVVRPPHLALRAGDGREHRPRRELPRIDVQRRQHAFHQCRLIGIVVDDVVGREPDVLPVDAQPARAHGVERPEV